MQLEQSGYKISRLILTPLPKSALLISACIVLLIMFINSILMSFSKPSFSYGDCLHKYYSLTHPNISTFITNQAQKIGAAKTPINLKQIFNYLSFVNSSSVLHFETSKVLHQNSECIIELDYNTTNQQKIQQNGLQISKYNTLGFLLSNYPLINLNLTDRKLLAKHNVKVDRIIVPPIDSGFRYLGLDVFVNNIEDFMYNTMQEFNKFQQEIRDQWIEYREQIQKQLQEAGKKQKQQQTEKMKKEVQKQIISNKSKTQSTVNQTVSDNENNNSKAYLSVLSPFSFLQSNNITEDNKGSNNATQQSNETSIAEVLAGKWLMINNLIIINMKKSVLSSHRLIYRLDFSGKMLSMQFPESPASTQNYFIWQTISKLIYSFLLFGFLILIFHTVGICIRYTYIVLLTLLALIGGRRVYKYVGWLNRFTDLYKDPEEERRYHSRKIMIQICFSFITMYSLYAIMAKYLCETWQLVLSSFQYIPNHPIYSEHLFRTFFIIQFCHYLFFRTRICLSFFPKFSVLSTIGILITISSNHFYMTSAYLNFYFLFNMFLILAFLFLEKWISQQEFETGHRPCLQKPRMLFYLGFDLDWHKGIPPIWTIFQPWYDLSYASEQEKSYIDKNYELLYGKLLGVDQPQQLPQDQQEGEELSSFKQFQMSQNQSSS